MSLAGWEEACGWVGAESTGGICGGPCSRRALRRRRGPELMGPADSGGLAMGMSMPYPGSLVEKTGANGPRRREGGRGRA